MISKNFGHNSACTASIFQKSTSSILVIVIVFIIVLFSLLQDGDQSEASWGR
jgi:hypothetical protein